MIPEELEKLKAARSRTLELTKDCTQEDLDRAPKKCSFLLGESGAWSIAEILDHIVKVTTTLTKEIEKLIKLKESGRKTVLSLGMKDYDVSPVMIPAPLMPLAEPAFRVANSFASVLVPPSVRRSFIRTRSFPIRNPSRWQPKKGRPADELRQELEESMATLERLLSEHRDIDYGELVLNHTIFGRNSVPQIIETLFIHEEWHHQDLEKLVTKE